MKRSFTPLLFAGVLVGLALAASFGIGVAYGRGADTAKTQIVNVTAGSTQGSGALITGSSTSGQGQGGTSRTAGTFAPGGGSGATHWL